MKVKTHKATAKRFRVTAKGKFMKRTAGQDHFNARESGVVTRRKRRDVAVAKVNVPAIRKLIFRA
ncbi:MAG: 50S ribosomal protein L35 [Candidatus Veblenbacteria bacterium]|nr:50S ribosomal protein L35 [Candidatus Veblenbacteria bacterium]MDZ4230005.1 50S ribosomal protein L35 [Candidatus Veblenbacteria bacterium]